MDNKPNSFKQKIYNDGLRAQSIARAIKVRKMCKEEGKTRVQVAKELGISPDRVRQLLRKLAPVNIVDE